MSAARIGKIRMKAGGAEIRILRRTTENNGENWRGTIVEHAKIIAEAATPECKLVGFLVLGMFSNGTISNGWRYDHSSPGVLPRAVLPAYVSEIVRREMITGPEAQEAARVVFNRANGYADDED